ncbi:hypothetical protein [Priestia megaterium]|uniref:hypothetical protein n=1 Tax=Priestia megaterium TaxID=1404 RepID=UPI001ABF0619|nr:hypothetical protein [Priestia megaterium]
MRTVSINIDGRTVTLEVKGDTIEECVTDAFKQLNPDKTIVQSFSYKRLDNNSLMRSLK